MGIEMRMRLESVFDEKSRGLGESSFRGFPLLFGYFYP